MSNVCRSCGTLNADGAPYCANCGAQMPEALGSDRKRASSAQLLDTVAINPMDPSEGSTEEGVPASWKEKIHELRKGPVTQKMIYWTVALTFVATIFSGIGAGIVAKGVLTETKSFTCCTSSACNYGGGPIQEKFFGAKIDPTKVTANAQGVCVGPDFNGVKCDGSQISGSDDDGSGNGFCSPTDRKNRSQSAGVMSDYYVYAKCFLVLWSFFLFLYTIYYKGAEWHANGEKNCCCCPENKECVSPPLSAVAARPLPLLQALTLIATAPLSRGKPCSLFTFSACASACAWACAPYAVTAPRKSKKSS